MKIQEEILAAIEEYQTIIIHRHQSPDPDALGSQGGLGALLKASFPEKKIYLVGSTVASLDYLVQMDEIEDTVYEGALVIVTDTANAPRISDPRFNLGAKLIKIDHHPDHEPYGDLSWVDTVASSCSEIIADFYQQFQERLTLTAEAARLLYAGIVGDTGRFFYPATTQHTLEIAALLRGYTFDVDQLHRQMDEISLAVARLSGFVWQNLEIDEAGAAKVILPQAILKEYGVEDSETGACIPLPGKVDQVVAWGIFVEQPDGKYRARLRSKGPTINEIARRHDGGGHALASGANAANLEEVTQIYQEIQELVRQK